jgi:hypothetical protein
MSTYTQRVVIAQVGFWLAKRASRNKSWLDRISRRLLDRILRFQLKLDDMVVQDQGYDPEELERYQQGR